METELVHQFDPCFRNVCCPNSMFGIIIQLLLSACILSRFRGKFCGWSPHRYFMENIRITESFWGVVTVPIVCLFPSFGDNDVIFARIFLYAPQSVNITRYKNRVRRITRLSAWQANECGPRIGSFVSRSEGLIITVFFLPVWSFIGSRKRAIGFTRVSLPQGWMVHPNDMQRG